MTDYFDAFGRKNPWPRPFPPSDLFGDYVDNAFMPSLAQFRSVTNTVTTYKQHKKRYPSAKGYGRKK